MKLNIFLKSILGRVIRVLFFTLFVTAHSTHAEFVVALHGVLLEAPPCIVNEGKTIIVDFGDEVITSRVNGQLYRQKIDFTLNCDSTIKTKQKLRISGNTASDGFDGTVILTEKKGLGIALYAGNRRYTPGEWLDFDTSSIPQLYAVPEKQNGITLTGGAFSALASLIVEYQ
ncbi:fimbrial protein [Pantoea allii]|uniref:Fimbrial protein n=1 Tax=Pantoea allii TaxID=574096 RepID=A0ABS6VFI6_9GAMM|nr:fimbrial protein [Pantoea allii]MBW1214090.1 fimbrial protein [Pantoea allii]MBW1258071.1 fimbrial protein [Pantoea allii]MBW1267083.1 fimbrial protein [Pantoea allii]MBW1289320.1 fimbrial protein [Pantoea allii]